MPKAFHLDVPRLPGAPRGWQGWATAFSCCLEVSITSVATGYRNKVPRKRLLVLNDRLKLTGIRNSNSFDNPRVTDLQVGQALWAEVFQDNWPLPEGHRGTSSFGGSCPPCAATARLTAKASPRDEVSRERPS